MAIEYEHSPLPRQVQTISGYYRLEQEKLLETAHGQVLYLTGFGVVDSSCCGVGGCSYALVPGLVLELKHGWSAQGWDVSRIEEVSDPGRRRDIAAKIKQLEQVQQVLFQEAQ